MPFCFGWSWKVPPASSCDCREWSSSGYLTWVNLVGNFVETAVLLARTLLCLQVDCVNSLTFPTADVVKTNGRSEEALEETPGSERDTHFFVGDLRLPEITRCRFLSFTGRSIRRLPIYVSLPFASAWAFVCASAHGSGIASECASGSASESASACASSSASELTSCGGK